MDTDVKCKTGEHRKVDGGNSFLFLFIKVRGEKPWNIL
jgi:hypothetical protein